MKDLGFHFQPDRWEDVQVDPDGFWNEIEKEFEDGFSTLEVFLERKFEYDSVSIGGRIEIKQPEEKIDYAFSAGMSLLSIVQQKIIPRTIDTEFVWSWGEFQKAIAVLNETYPAFKTNEMLREEAKARRKDRARQWYALWYELYLNSKYEPKSRVAFNQFLENFLTELKFSKRVPKRGSNLRDLIILINQLSSPEVKDCVRLPKSFSTDGMSNAKVLQFLQDARSGGHPFPPVGEEFYPRR